MATVDAPSEFVLSIVINASVEKVWREITKTGSLQRPLYNTVMESDLRPGARLRYYSPDRKRVFVVGKVLEIEPPRLFKHTYVFTMNAEPPTVVTWRLDPQGNGCKVTLTHTGFTSAHKAPQKTGAGWKEILALLKQEVETGTIPFGTRAMYTVMGWTSFMLPKTTLVEHADKQGW